jgi:hypothetical protein
MSASGQHGYNRCRFVSIRCGGSMETKPLPRICWICGKAVPLEECKVDEHGLAVHEKCYVAKLALEAPLPRSPGRRV